MKLDRLFTRIEAILTGWFLAFSSVACLVTAFHMEPVKLWLLALYCAVGALVTGLLCTRRLGLLLAGLLALGAGYLWQKGILEESTESLLYKISRLYHDAYNWPIIRWSWRTAPDMELTLAPIIYILGTLLAVITAWTVCKGQSSIVACLPAALPVAACFVVTDTLPDTVWLLLFLTAMAVLMLTSTTRQTDRAQGRRLAAMAVIPVFLAVGILFLSVPRQTYYHKEKAQAITDFLVGKHTLEQMLDSLAGITVQTEQKSVDLAALGARNENQTKVLEVTTRYQSGTLYLRTTALDRYTGTAWVDSETVTPELYWPSAADGAAYQIDEVHIKSQYAHEMLYLPYYPASLDISNMTRGLRNEKKLNEYSVTRIFLEHLAPFAEAIPLSAEERVQVEASTRLTETTKKWAIPLAKQIVGDVKDPYTQAQLIAQYVQNSAKYNKNTGRMSDRYKDFAQWFLEESDSGYCVHFATAGAVLLKALGIPARYATGYMVQTQAGTATEVTVANAHAWVEYWLSGFGWTMLECTPPDHSADTPPVQIQPQQTQPAQTEPSSPAPDLQLPDQPGVNRKKPALSKALYLLLIPVFFFAVWLQRKLRLAHRKRQLDAHNTNRQALLLWQQVERLSRCLGAESPEMLRILAEKAKFSPYTITQTELQAFRDHLQQCITRLKKKNFFLRLYHQWILVLY